MPAGRRSGKTELSKRRLVRALATKKPWQDPRYFAAAPTKEQAKRIFWRDLKELTPSRWIKRIYESELCIRTVMGSELWVVGLDKPERMEGVAWDGGVLDEFANMRPGAWGENIRPSLSDRRGWCWFIGVPEGLNHFKDIADYALSGTDPEWGCYKWKSADILPLDEIDSARRELDPKTFRQEYEASFEGSSGRVYYAFESEKHLDKEITLDLRRPIIVCCDFNVDPCQWVLVQSDGVSVQVFDEIQLYNTNTVEMGRELLRRYKSHAPGFLMYGDAAGSARSTTGKSDYALLTELGLVNQRVKAANPAVKDRVNAVNSMLENSEGEVRLTVHPSCMSLKRDFETVSWKENSGEINKSDRRRTHASDAIGYFIEYEFPLRAYKPDRGKIFYK